RRERLGGCASGAAPSAPGGATQAGAASRGEPPRRDAADVEGVVVVADAQTAGRGRRGHSWFSPPGSGLYASVILVPGRSTADPGRATSLLTLAAGVALSEAIGRAAGLHVDLKWPNDLFVAQRKLGGILAEASPAGETIGAVVLGYGINLQPAAYPPALADAATSIGSETGRAIDRRDVLVETLAALGARYDDL